MTNLNSVLQSKDITLPTKVHVVSSGMVYWVQARPAEMPHPSLSTPSLSGLGLGPLRVEQPKGIVQAFPRLRQHLARGPAVEEP